MATDSAPRPPKPVKPLDRVPPVANFMATDAPPVAVPPPPVMSTEALRRLPPVSYAIDVMGEGKLLWRGVLRVASFRGASYSQSVQQASEWADRCPGRTESGYDMHANVEETLRVNLNGRPQPGSVISINISWIRTVPGTCESGGPAARSVSLAKSMVLDAKGVGEASGDAGLIVRLRRQ